MSSQLEQSNDGSDEEPEEKSTKMESKEMKGLESVLRKSIYS